MPLLLLFLYDQQISIALPLRCALAALRWLAPLYCWLDARLVKLNNTSYH
jgi:hypothetical protein